MAIFFYKVYLFESVYAQYFWDQRKTDVWAGFGKILEKIFKGRLDLERQHIETAM
jgi:hypothetical protein